MLRFLLYQTHPQKASPPNHGLEETVDHRRRDHLQRVNLWPLLVTLFSQGAWPIIEDTVFAPSQRATGDIHSFTKPTPNIRRHEGRIGKAASSVRPRTAVSRTGSRTHSPRMGGDEIPERLAPRPDRGPPEHLSTAFIAREVQCTEATGDEQSQSRRRRRAASSTPSEQSNDESRSHHPRTKD